MRFFLRIKFTGFQICLICLEFNKRGKPDFSRRKIFKV